jgi:hypothetical protein
MVPPFIFNDKEPGYLDNQVLPFNYLSYSSRIPAQETQHDSDDGNN